jgi:hypothetical protein
MATVDEILLVVTTKTDALVRKSPDQLSEILHPSFIYINAAGKRFSKQQYIEAYCIARDMVFVSQAITDVKVQDFHDFAVATMTLFDQYKRRGRLTSATYRSLYVFGKIRSKWLWAAGHTASME